MYVSMVSMYVCQSVFVNSESFETAIGCAMYLAICMCVCMYVCVYVSIHVCICPRFLVVKVGKLGRLRSRPLHGTKKKNEGSRCPSAESKTRKAQFSRSQCFDALNSPEKYWNRVLCSECVGILQPGETKTLWPEKWFENIGWDVYDVLGAWDSTLECCIASTIVKASKTDLSTVFWWKQRCQSTFSCACDVLGS